MNVKAPPAQPAPGSLGGLKVVDLGHYIAGPYCASLLGGLGAEVIKVERPERGDGSRWMGPFPGDEPHPEKSGLFSYLNLSKKSLALNLKSEAGKEALLRLIAQCDVLIENFAPRVLPSLGLAYETLREVNPGLVMTSISNFGQSGPYRDYKGYEITVNALGGIQFEIGEPDREPLKLGGYQMQFQTGLAAAVATLGAVLYRDLSGGGQHVDVAILEVAATMKGAPLTYYQYTGYRRTRNGVRSMNDGPRRKGDPPPDPRDPGIYPTVILPAKDGFVGVDTQTHQQWTSLCQWIGRPELVDDPRFIWDQRGPNADALDAILGGYYQTKTREELFAESLLWRVPFGAVHDTGSILHDQQHLARGFFSAVEHSHLGLAVYPGHPFIMNETPWRQTAPAPLLGEHSREILLGRLGYSEDEVAMMAKTGAI